MNHHLERDRECLRFALATPAPYIGVLGPRSRFAKLLARLRSDLRALYSQAVADDTLILYGGSVKPGNIDALMAMNDIDGALVGGASLDEADFHRIIWFETPRKKS